MLSNLKAEMVRYNVTVSEIAKFSGKSKRTIVDRINGKVQFPIQDAINVKNRFFPKMDLEYLFSPSDTERPSA